MTESLGALFLPHPRRTFPLIKPLNWRWGRKTVQVRKEHEGFEKISKGSKRGLKLILVPRCYHAVALLSGKPLVAIWSSMIGSSIMMTEMLLLLFRLWELAFLALGFLTFFFSSLGGAPKIDLPLSMFSLANLVLISLFSILTLLVGGTKTVVLEEAILEEERPYPKPVRSEADFWMLSISSSFVLEVLSSWALT